MKLHQEFLHADNRLESFEASEEDAIKRTLSFSWDSELEHANHSKMCSPTVSLEYPEKKRVLWASVIEKKDEAEFLVCFQEKRAPKGFMRLFSKEEKDVIVAQKDGIVLNALPNFFRTFYRGKFEKLETEINMTLPFIESSTLKKKIAVCFLPILGLMLFSLFSPVLINENVIFTLSVVTAIASVLAIIYFVRESLNKTSKLHEIINKQRVNPIISLLLLCLCAPLFLYMSISIGIPSVLHTLISEPGESVITVESKLSDRHCRNGIYTEEYKYLLNGRVCGIKKTDWESLVLGDKIRLLGSKSYFGFSYDRYIILSEKMKK